MICPYCDSRISKLADNHVCPHCGAPLGDISIQEKIQLLEPPLGIYKQSYGYMEIQEHGIRFYEKFLWSKKERVIPYSELTDVRFVLGEGLLGFLSVRDKQTKHLPMPNKPSEAAGDITSFVFGKSEKERYRVVYEFLKQCAQIANNN